MSKIIQVDQKDLRSEWIKPKDGEPEFDLCELCGGYWLRGKAQEQHRLDCPNRIIKKAN